jgi:hypothetical protein
VRSQMIDLPGCGAGACQNPRVCRVPAGWHPARPPGFGFGPRPDPRVDGPALDAQTRQTRPASFGRTGTRLSSWCRGPPPASVSGPSLARASLARGPSLRAARTQSLHRPNASNPRLFQKLFFFSKNSPTPERAVPRSSSQTARIATASTACVRCAPRRVKTSGNDEPLK